MQTLRIQPTPTIPVNRARVEGQLVSTRADCVKVRWFQHWSGTSYAGDTEEEHAHYHVAWWFPWHNFGDSEVHAFQRLANRQSAESRCRACSYVHFRQ